LHPRVAEVIPQPLRGLAAGGSPRRPFSSSRAACESGIHKKLDGLVVVWWQTRAATRTPPRSRPSAKQKPAAASMPSSRREKLRLASEKIDCSGSLEQTPAPDRSPGGEAA